MFPASILIFHGFFPAFSHPPVASPRWHPRRRLDLLLRRVGQRVLRQQLVDGAVEALRRGAVVAQDVDHQGVVEQTSGEILREIRYGRRPGEGGCMINDYIYSIHIHIYIIMYVSLYKFI